MLVGADHLLGQLLELGLGLGTTAGPLRSLQRQFGEPLLGALPTFDHIADALLEPTDFERGLGQAPLRCVQLVAGSVVRLADGLELGLALAQFGHAGLERVDCGGDFLLDALLLAGRIPVAQEPQLMQLQGAVVLQAAVAPGDLGLLLELLEVAVELAQDVVDAGEVVARVAQPVLGLAAALLVLGHTSRLFQEQAQFLGLAFDDPADRPLADDRVGTRAEPGAEEHVLHVAPTHRLVVDVVAAAAVAGQNALDGDLGELVPLATGTGVLIAEHELDAGTTGRLALARSVEDHVLHRFAAQLGRLAFTEHPAHCVHDVRLAAAVRADHADQLAGQLKVGGVGERLEAGQLDGIQTHVRERIPVRTAIGMRT